MKVGLICLLILFTIIDSAGQFSPPKGFRLVKGENLSGEDDIYTNGKCSFDTHKIIRAYDFSAINDSFKAYLSNSFWFPFYITSDTLCWGTGRHKGFFSYVAVGADGELVELYSNKNDEAFSNYSKRLLATARKYKQKGRSLIFPMHNKR